MNVRSPAHLVMLCAAAFGASACLSTDPALDPDSGASRNQADSDADPPEAARIESAQDFLASYGYLPSEGSTRQSLVEREPVRGELDDATQQALRIYQARNQLKTTGKVDDATWALMQTPRCGVPDHEPRGDAAGGTIDKYAAKDDLDFTSAGNFSIRVLRYPSASTGLSQAEVHTAIDEAAAMISDRSGARITRITSGDPAIDAYFYTGNNPPEGCEKFPAGDKRLAITVTFVREDNRRIVDTKLCVNTAHDFDDSDDSAFDLQSLLLHEFGHAIGFDHSSVSGSAMNPNLAKNRDVRSLTPDDLMGIRAKHGDWERDNGSIAARDIAWGSDSVLWGISNTETSGGYEIWKRAGTQRDAFNGVLGPWVKVPGGATRIAVEDATPWVVNRSGNIYRRKADDSGWENIPGCARDIGANQVGVWIVGCETAPEGGGNKVYAYQWVYNNWKVFAGVGAERVAVEANGTPWITQTDHDVYRMRAGVWRQVNAAAVDVGSQSGGDVWLVGDNERIYHYNHQEEVEGLDEDGNTIITVPYRDRFVAYPWTGGAVAVAPWSGEATITHSMTVYDIKDRYSSIE